MTQDAINQKATEIARELSEVEPDKKQLIGMVGSQLFKAGISTEQIEEALAHVKGTWNKTKTAAEAEHNGKKGKWRTIWGHRIFLEEGKEEIAIKGLADKLEIEEKEERKEEDRKEEERKKKLKETRKKIFEIEEAIQPFADKEEERIWNEKYAEKWDDAIAKTRELDKHGIPKDDILDLLHLSMTDEIHDKHIKKLNDIYNITKNKDWVGDNLGKMTKILEKHTGSEHWSMHGWKSDRSFITIEEANSLASSANRVMKTKKYKPEDFDNIWDAEENMEHVRDNAKLKEDRFYRDYFSEEAIGKFFGPHDAVSHALLDAMKTDLLQFKEDFYDVPEFKAMIDLQEETNAVAKRRLKNAKSFYRGTGWKEVENFAKMGYIGAGPEKYEDDSPTSLRYNTAHEFGTMAGGVVFEYDAQEVGEHAESVNYNVMANWEYSDYGHPAIYRYEEEYLLPVKKKIKPKKLRIHVIVKPKGETRESIKKKYGHLGEIVYGN